MAKINKLKKINKDKYLKNKTEHMKITTPPHKGGDLRELSLSFLCSE